MKPGDYVRHKKDPTIIYLAKYVAGDLFGVEWDSYAKNTDDFEVLDKEYVEKIKCQLCHRERLVGYKLCKSCFENRLEGVSEITDKKLRRLHVRILRDSSFVEKNKR